MNSRPKLLILTGPTGTGKTAVAIELCERLNAEIISADSMQVYRGCDIGTAKITDEERTRAPHHLIDIRDADEEYSAVQWAQDAQTAIRDIAARGRQPIIVGGTGFYLNALLHPERFPDVAPNPELRASLERDAAEHGAVALHQRLAQLDPAAADRLHPNDIKRVVRAIEVALAPAANDPPGLSNPLTSPATMGYAIVTFGLEMPREQLYRRLELRIDKMLEAGFMDELRRLAAAPGAEHTLALQSLGYRQMLPVLNGDASFDEAVELWKRDTRRYAKRQMTWFRHQLPMTWIPIDEQSNPHDVAATIVELFLAQRENEA